MPGALGHPDVQQDDVGRRGRGQAGALETVARLADHVDALLGRQEHRQPASEQLLVVDNKDPDWLYPVAVHVSHAAIMTRLGGVAVRFGGTNGASCPSSEWPVRASRSLVTPRGELPGVPGYWSTSREITP